MIEVSFETVVDETRRVSPRTGDVASVARRLLAGR
jgi:hypothetical protein